MWDRTESDNDACELPLDCVLEGDCLEVLDRLPGNSVDMIFADPPYNLQLQQELWRPNMTRVDAVDEDWDKFADFAAYDRFTRGWLAACRRVLKDTGTLWVIGTYHNIFRVGTILQDLGYWVLNDIVWIKANPMPNFRGVRFTNAHETLIWACKFRGARYTFNYHAMKSLNNDKQMRSDWELPICSGAERLKANGEKVHPTQKPEALLYRVILSSTNPGDIVLDPFLGSGTTAVVAKKLHRRWIGIERNPRYAEVARRRISDTAPAPYSEQSFKVGSNRRRAPRVEFAALVEAGLLPPGQQLFFKKNPNLVGYIRADGKLALADGFVGSIHETGRHLSHGAPCNGWEHWYLIDGSGNLVPINALRREYCATQPDE